MKLPKLFLLVLWLSLLMQVSLAEVNRFVSFVNNPTPAHYDAIVAELNVQTAEYKEWNGFQRDYKEWVKFLRLIEAANTLAIDLAEKLAPKTDGANLEDLCRAVGMNVRSHPELVLQVLKKNRVSEYQLGCRLTMLPKSTIDKIDTMLVELEARAAAISTVKNLELSDYKKMAMTILYDEIYSLRGARGDIPFQKRR